MTEKKIPRSFGTHDGSFHADEVTACALLLFFKLIDKNKIFRTRDIKLLDTCEYVCDVGGIHDSSQKRFDHHQVQYDGSLSSAGMVLEYLHHIKEIDDGQYSFLKHSFVDGVDSHDNGKDPLIPGLCTYSHIIASYNPIKHDGDPDALNKAFNMALKFALDFIKRIWKRHKYTQSCKKIVEKARKKYKDCLIFEDNIPWLESFFELEEKSSRHPATFVIMPSGNHWKLRGIPPTYDQRMQVRVPLPEEWAGLLEDNLRKVSGIPGAIFCHKGRFISVWETREDALKALEIVLQKNSYLQNKR